MSSYSLKKLQWYALWRRVPLVKRLILSSAIRRDLRSGRLPSTAAITPLPNCRRLRFSFPEVSQTLDHAAPFRTQLSKRLKHASMPRGTTNSRRFVRQSYRGKFTSRQARRGAAGWRRCRDVEEDVGDDKMAGQPSPLNQPLTIGGACSYVRPGALARGHRVLQGAAFPQNKACRRPERSP
jgi:hypothetical protein